ncbi:MAG: hypothetical protein KKD17_05025 [Nanoarchaeota archaeon]|nr:hypothetical protein [Nanoarchaeota archaeon]
MKIEVDTKHDSREELAALADMLRRLSSSSGSGVVSQASSTPRNIFEDPSPSGGMFNMFGDSPSQSSSSGQDSSSSQQSSGDLFSLFSSSPEQGAAQQPSQPMSAQPSVSELLSSDYDDDKDKEMTAAQDLLDDDRIVPY